jgi:putative phosphoribosyl transferase
MSRRPVVHARETAIHLPLSGVVLNGDLTIPEEATGIVLFAHGSGSSRLSPRNRQVAHTLQDKGLATLLFDLLTAEEALEDARTAMLRFDVHLLADRLGGVTDLVEQGLARRELHIGYFGASTGAAAALIAAARRPGVVEGVVSRGGRPDLAGASLESVRAPTLLIVGELDEQVIDLNREALRRLSCVKRMEIIPGATHLFEEPGALEVVARLAADWFAHHLTGPITHPVPRITPR